MLRSFYNNNNNDNNNVNELCRKITNNSVAKITEKYRNHKNYKDYSISLDYSNNDKSPYTHCLIIVSLFLSISTMTYFYKSIKQ
jgi:hypothetical protein